MKILVPTAGEEPAKENVKYIVNIAKKLGADLLALHIRAASIKKPDEKALDIFNEEGSKAGVSVWRIMWAGGVVEAIKMAAEKEKVDLIVMGVSDGKVVSEWTSSSVAERTNIPVVVIPYGHCINA